MKVVHPGLAHDEEFRSGSAVRSARQAVDARVAAVLAADPGARQPWLATQYVPGLALDEAVDGVGVLPRDAVHVLARRLAEARPRSTRAAWSTATSSRRTCCWPRTGRT